MSIITCPHCQAENPIESKYCQSCGMALPEAGAAGPQIVHDGSLASSGVGQALQTEELRKKSRASRGALMAVAILNFIAAAIVHMLFSNGQDVNGMMMPEETVKAMVVGCIVVGLIYVGLFMWAKKSPFPASVIGLVLFVTLHAVNTMQNPESLMQGIVIKVIILIALINGVKAGAEYRRIQQASQRGY